MKALTTEGLKMAFDLAVESKELPGMCKSLAPSAIRYCGAWEGNRFKGVYVTIWAGLELDRFGFAAEYAPAPVDMPFNCVKDAEKAARRFISTYGAQALRNKR